MAEQVSKGLSKRIVETLLAEGLDLPKVAKDAGTTPAFLKKVIAGEAALQVKHRERLDRAHPDLPFRIAATIVREEAVGLAKRAGDVGRKVGKALKAKGGEVAEGVGETLRKGLWKLLR